MAQFALVHRIDQKEITGSDKYFPIDGRLNIFNAIDYAKNIAKKLMAVRSDVYSVRIYRGDLKNNHAISGYHVI